MNVRGYALTTGLLSATVVLSVRSDVELLVVELVLVGVATAAMARGIRRRRPPRPSSWWCLLAGPWAVLIGAIAVEVAVALDAPAVAVESTILLEVAGYVLLARGMHGLVAPDAEPATRGDRVDAAVMLLAVGLLGWAVISPTFPHGGVAGVIERVGEVAQMVLSASCLLLAIVIVVVGRRGRPAGVLLLGAGVALAVEQFALPFVQRLVEVPNIDDAALLVGLVLLAGAATHPRMAAIVPEGGTSATRARSRVLALVLSLAAPPALAVADRLSGGMVSQSWLLAAWCLLTVVVVHRLLVLDREREAMLATMSHRARYDDLTGVLNRRGLSEELPGVFDGADRHSRHVAVLYLDLDGFKPVNDAHGHAAGDQVLLTIARRLRERAGDRALVARVGGDEFVVVHPDVEGRAELAERITRVRQAVADPIELPDGDVRIGCSIGVDHRPPRAHGWASAVERADEAMYAAKRDTAVDAVAQPAAVKRSLPM